MYILKLWQEKAFTHCVGPAWFTPATSRQNQIPRTTNYPQFCSPQGLCLGWTGSIPRNRSSNNKSLRSHRQDYISPAYSHSLHYRNWWWTSRWNSASCKQRRKGIINYKAVGLKSQRSRIRNWKTILEWYILIRANAYYMHAQTCAESPLLVCLSVGTNS